MKKENALRELLIEEMRRIYHAELQLLKALPKMTKAAQSERLKEAFEAHLEETESHVERLERAFESMNEQAKPKNCQVVQMLLDGLVDSIAEHKEGVMCDAVILCGMAKVEHYEIAAYSTICTWCDLLGLDEASDLLKETLDEERTAEETIIEITESEIDLEGEGGDGENDANE
ncbi:MAG: DUF892 family protein [Patescibacteria group bacterium]